MREILFRGKRTDNSAWETGSLVVIWPGTSMETVFITDKSTGYQTKVDPSTVGQYTGLTDKNSKRIFEGDIVRCVSNAAEHIFVVVWDHEEFGFKATNGKTNYGSNFVYLWNCEEIEIISNLHENLQ